MITDSKMANETRAQEIIKTQKTLSSNRSQYETVWRQIAERMWPAYVESFTPTGTQKIPQVAPREMIYDSTATIALGRFGAILDSLLTPRNQTWHRLMASDPALNKDRQCQLWFEDFTRAMFKYRYAPKANFAAQNQQNYQSLGAFGTGCVFIDDLAGEPGVRYHAVHLGEIFFRENHQGLVDTAFRYYMVKAINFMKNKRWEGKVPKVIQDAAKMNPDKEFAVIHSVQPRTDIQVGRLDYKGMPFISEYITVDEPTILSENGFTSFPYAISRYEQAPGEVYGRSPGMQVLPTVKTLNEQMRSLLKQGQRAVDPVLLAYDDGVMSGFQLKSGALNYGGVSKDGRELIKPLQTGRMDIGRDMINDSRSTINDAFLVSLFQILVETPTATATEILERAKEKGILLAPTIGRQQSEYLGPLIEREADLLIETTAYSSDANDSSRSRCGISD